MTVSMPSSMNDGDLSELQARLAAVRTNVPAMNVSRGMVQGIAQNSTAENKKTTEIWYPPSSGTSSYPGLDGHPRRITPIPVAVATSEPAIVKNPDQIRQETAEFIDKLEKERKAR